jgi:protein required for attachment to host cells
MKPWKIWALVADNSKARIVMDLLSDQPSERTIVAPKPLLAGAIMADRPGRSQSSAGARRSAMEYRTDPVRVRDREFAALVAETFADALKGNRVEGVALAAPPRMLGDLRSHLPSAVRRLVIAEIDKDLVKLQPAALARRIAEAIPKRPLT